LLVVNPLAALLLITRHMVLIEPTRLVIAASWILLIVEIVGLPCM